MKRRNRFAGFLILALALAVEFIAFRPGPDLVPYTTPWMSNGKEELRISLLVPAAWRLDPENGPESGGVWLRPARRYDWMPEWARRLMRADAGEGVGSLGISSEELPDRVGVQVIGEDAMLRCFAGGGYVYYTRTVDKDRKRTMRNVLDSARIVGRRPLNR